MGQIQGVLGKRNDAYKAYFLEEKWQNRMVRNDSYVYILNPTELGYE